MASLYKRSRSPFFWIKYRDASGQLRQESTGWRHDTPLHVRRARELEAEKTLAELKHGGGKGAKSEGWEWVPDYLTIRYGTSPTLERYKNTWTMLRLFLNSRQISGPQFLLRQHCFDYVTWRRSPDGSHGKYQAKLNTALLELKVLSIVMQEAVERGIITGNPCYKLGIRREIQPVKPELSAADCETIRRNIELMEDGPIREMLRLSFEIARYQGCRLSETRLNPMTDVQIRTVNGVKAGQILFRTKGGRDLPTALHPKLIPLFEELQSQGRTTTWTIPKGGKRQWPSIQWWKFLNRIGLKSKGVTFHCTRVTVVTELARNNVPESKAKSYVGHSSTTVHRIYQRLRADDLGDCTAAVG